MTKGGSPNVKNREGWKGGLQRQTPEGSQIFQRMKTHWNEKRGEGSLLMCKRHREGKEVWGSEINHRGVTRLLKEKNIVSKALHIGESVKMGVCKPSQYC